MKRVLSTMLAVLLAFVMAMPVTILDTLVMAGAPPDQQEFVPGEVLLKFQGSYAELYDLVAELNQLDIIEVVKVINGEVYKIILADKSEWRIFEAIDILSQNPHVAHAQPNYIGKYNDDIIIAPSLPERFVMRLYINILERNNVDQNDIAYWVNHLLKGTLTAADLIDGFFFSEEFLSKDMNDQHYIKLAYNTFLDRDPDAEGLAFWLNQLANGYSRRHVIALMIGDWEFAALCDQYGVPVGQLPANKRDKLEAFVVRMYQYVLERDFDICGLDFWANGLASGEYTGADIAESFLFSEEFTSRAPTDEEFLETLYRALMCREADAIGMDYWLDMILGGMNQRTVIGYFIESDEFTILCENYGIEPGQLGNNVELGYPVITWEILDDGGTGAALKDGVLINVQRHGSVNVQVTVDQGIGTVFTRTYDFWVHPADSNVQVAQASVEHFIAQSFQSIFKRTARYMDYSYNWKNALINKEATTAEMLDAFCISPGFISSKISDLVFVQMFYQILMDRMPNAEESAYWAAFFKNGGAPWYELRRQFLQSVVDNDEFRAFCAYTDIIPGTFCVETWQQAAQGITWGVITEFDYNVQIIRVDWLYDDQAPIVIFSRAELEEYLQSAVTHGSPYIQLNKYMGVYTDAFFAENYLVIVTTVEGSGSIRHEVERIDENGDIYINKLIPYNGNADMAEWKIFIEFNKDFKPEQINAILQDIPIGWPTQTPTPTPTPTPDVPLTPEQIEKLYADYIKYCEMVSNSKVDIEDVYLHRYFGTINDCIIVDMRGWLGYPQVIISIKVADYTITYPDGKIEYVYVDGTFISVRDAYAMGYFTSDNVYEFGCLFDDGFKERYPTAKPTPELVDFNVQMYPTYWHGNIETIPTVIYSMDSLEAYYNVVCLDNYSNWACTLWELTQAYDDTFFTDNYLIIVNMNGGSGTTRYEVDRINTNGDIFINRLYHVHSTPDMVDCFIAIELSNDFNPEQFNAILQDKQIG